jgi:hypothetical protein
MNNVWGVSDLETEALLIDGSNYMLSTLNTGNNRIINLGNPVLANDGATKSYVDAQTLAFLKTDGTNQMLANLNTGNNKVINVLNPTNSQDAATKNYVDTRALLPTTTFTFPVATGNGTYNWTDFNNIPSGFTENSFDILPSGFYGCFTDYLAPTRKGILPGGTKGYLTCYAYQNGGGVYNKRYTWTSNANNSSIVYVSTLTENTWNTWVIQNPILTNGTNSMTAALNMGTNTINNVVNPTTTQQAATKNYVDNVLPLVYETTYPLMTGDTTIINGLTYIASTDFQTNVTFPPWQAFSGNVGQNGFLVRFFGTWLQLQYPYTVIATGFTIKVRNQSGRNITGYTLSGSLDGVTFTTLTTNTGVPFNAGTTITVNFANSKPYFYYRFTVTNFTGGVDVGIDDLKYIVTPINANYNVINNVVDPTTAQQAATKSYVDTADLNLQTQINSVIAGTAGATVAFSNQTTVAVPTTETLIAMVLDTAITPNPTNPALLNAVSLAINTTPPLVWYQVFKAGYYNLQITTNYNNGAGACTLTRSIKTSTGTVLTTLPTITFQANTTNNPVSASGVIFISSIPVSPGYVLFGVYNTASATNLTRIARQGTCSIQSVSDNGLYLSLSGGIMSSTGTGINMNSKPLTGISLPVASSDAASKDYVDTNVILRNGTNSMFASLNMGGNTITNLLNPFNTQDAATKSYVDTRTPTFPTNFVDQIYITGTGTPSGTNISWANMISSPNLTTYFTRGAQDGFLNISNSSYSYFITVYVRANVFPFILSIRSTVSPFSDLAITTLPSGSQPTTVGTTAIMLRSGGFSLFCPTLSNIQGFQVWIAVVPNYTLVPV